MFNYDKIPQEMKNLNRWVLWKKTSLEDGKTTKIPINAKNGYGAKSNDPSTWTSFNEALAMCEYFNCNGLGFMLGDGYFGVDIDHAIENTALLNEFIDTLKSYTEYSQSGEGIHIICKGVLPIGNRRKGNIEMYDNARFFALTGNVVNDYQIKDNTSEIIPLWNKYIGQQEIKPKMPEISEGQYIYTKEANINTIPANLSTQEVINKALESKNGAVFGLLYRGQWENYYPSQSEADMAFCSLLAFWTGRNAKQMDEIVRSSGLMRDKWDRKLGASTYGENTIQNAIAKCKDIYEVSSKPKITIHAQTQNTTDKVYELNDTGNAERFVDLYGGDLRYNHENKYWMIWDGKTWVKDNKQIVKIKADEMISLMKMEMLNETNEKYQDKLDRNIKHLSSNSGKEAMLKEAMHIGNIPTINCDYDINKYLLNCENGVVDLRSGKLLEHNKDYMMSKNTNIQVDMDNEPTIWIKTLKEIFLGKEEIYNYVWKAIGYSLTGDVKEQCFFQCYGNGSNGKSIFFNTIYNMLGGYRLNAQVDTILSRNKINSGNANPDLARLNGARFVRTNEPSEDARFNEGLVKQLTGGDPITARYLYGLDFEFKPIFKLWIATNYKIKVVGTDKGIWRRMRLIPFEACFEGNNDDKELENKLKIELPQILGWAIRGCLKWQKEGLIPPDEIVEATSEYRTEMDIIEKFSNNCLKRVKNGKEKANDLFEEYYKWATKSNEHKMSQTKFGIEMAKKYEKMRLNGYTYYLGIVLNKHDTSYVYEKEE